MKPSLLNEKEAARKQLRQPQDLMERAAQPEQLVEEKVSSEAADLQEKMKIAAKEFAALEWSNRGWVYEPEYRDLPFDVLISEQFLPYVHCTPEVVLFRLEDEWVRLTEENVGEAFIRVAEEYLGKECASKIRSYSSVVASENAKRWLTELRKVAKKYGKVSWALPKLQKGGALV